MLQLLLGYYFSLLFLLLIVVLSVYFMSFLNGKGFLEYYTIPSQTPDLTDYVDLASGKEVGGLGPRWFGFL